MSAGLERRAVELRSVGGSGRRLAGLVPYGAPADMGGGLSEVLESRALVPEPDVLALYAHNPADMLGRLSAGTLELDNRADALAFEIALPDTRLGQDVATLVARGDLKGCSWGFLARRDSWAGKRRTIHEARLFELSVVANPVFAATSLALRHAAAAGPWAWALRLRADAARGRR